MFQEGNTHAVRCSLRISRSAEITVDAPIKIAFPLFGPIREKEWADGWNPEILYANSDLEKHMIFTTPSQYEDEIQYTWILTGLFTDIYKVEYTVSTRERIWFITVQCIDAGDKTNARITYTYTGLTDQGNRRNEESLKRMFRSNLQDWQDAINYYLKTGKKLIE